VQKKNANSYESDFHWERKFFFLKNQITKNNKTKKNHFPAPPILNIFCENFRDWSYIWVYRINWLQRALLWLYGCQAVRRKLKRGVKMHFLFFYPFFWAYVGQPDDHVGWATSMPFASNLCYSPKNQSLKFLRKNIKNWRSWFWVIRFFKNKFCFS
jgi:hypothetical protein